MLHIAIIEDDPLQCASISELTEQFFAAQKEAVTFHIFRDGSEIVSDYPSGIDALLMDIDMPKLNGLEAARAIRQMDCDVDLIFVTNLIQCALDGYSVSAIDFVVKPVSPVNLGHALMRVLQRFRQRQSQYIEVTSQRSTQILNIREILYIETSRHSVLIHSRKGTLLVHEPLSALEKKLENQPFFRCHTSFLVNLKKIDHVGTTDLRIGGELIPISRHRRQELLTRMAIFMGEQF